MREPLRVILLKREVMRVLCFADPDEVELHPP
jgi:hypothetical protein